jgi:hypothetical protein
VIARTAAAPPHLRYGSPAWAYGFLAFLIACQLALAFTDLASVRLVARAGSFGASIVIGATLFMRRGAPHPAAWPASIALAVVTLSLLHPTTNGLMSGVAQVALYFAVLGPLFWVPRLRFDTATFRGAVLLIWLFGTASATLGVLQTYFPGEFQPNLSTVIAERDEAMLDGLRIVTSTGEQVFRPMGLTDVPGGAAIGGFYAVVFGMGFLLNARRLSTRTLCAVAMCVGMTTLYLSQIRSMVVLAVLCGVTLLAVLVWRRHVTKVVLLAAVLGAVVVIAFVFSLSIGGDSVASRVSTLAEESPAHVYYENRGFFLQYTIEELLPLYPLGAGLGRWGMTNAYFGGNVPPDRAPIFVEIQWTGWLLDGGVPLVAISVVTLAFAVVAAAVIARRYTAGAHAELGLWAALVVAYDVGICALTFNYPFFASQQGMEFWLVNAALFATAAGEARARRDERSA